MAFGVECVDYKQCVRKEFSLTNHAVRPKSARKIVHHTLWCLGPSCDHRREHVIPAFTLWNAVKPIADAMGAPCTHDASCQSPLTIMRVILRAFSTTTSDHFFPLVMSQLWVLGAMADLRHTVAASRLLQINGWCYLQYIEAKLFVPFSILANLTELQICHPRLNEHEVGAIFHRHVGIPIYKALGRWSRITGSFSCCPLIHDITSG